MTTGMIVHLDWGMHLGLGRNEVTEKTPKEREETQKNGRRTREMKKNVL